MEKLNDSKGLIQMSEQEKCSLWRQRFFEAQAGMERYLAEKYGSEEIPRWLPVRAEILEGLNHISSSWDALFWKKRFFKTQALLEKYLADNHDLGDMEGWTRAIGEIFKHTEPDKGGGTGDMALRLAKQAHCYGSQYEIVFLSKDHSEITLSHCAIWDFREEARRSGVQLTLKSPCSFCTRATEANIRAKGFTASYQLHESETDHGCTWEIKDEN